MALEFKQNKRPSRSIS